jgi:hypothetical protein
MSYIIKNTSPFVSIKLTEIGRENLAKGQLNFSNWGLGDSELNYAREEIVDANQSDISLSGSSKILRPFDRQPNIKSFITKSDDVLLTKLNQSDISVVKAVVNNLATERGFFSGTPSNYITLTSDTYMNGYSVVSNTIFTGGTSIVISGLTVNVNDILRIKLKNDTTFTGISNTENLYAIPNLWYKVQSTATTINGTNITVDRSLPNLVNETGSTSTVFSYMGGEVYEAFGHDTSTAYWDSGTLSFDSATNITCDDVKVWNMNNVWCESLAGITGLTTTNLYEDFTKFGSYDYLGAKNPYFEYLCSSTDTILPDCLSPGYSYLDPVNKSISILHYTNNTISNLYGEFFHIDTTNDKNLKITIPDLMYHRIGFNTGIGTNMGMSFTSSGTSKFIGTSEIEYYDLYEDPEIITGSTPIVVGKVFPQLKTVVIDDDEIVAALSYKSNRNWTLPPLSAFLSSPTGGTTTGVLDVNKTVYLTYALDNSNGTGLTPTLPCQTYVKVTNNSSTSKDISFKISDINLLPYMRKIEDLTYDGLGFYATDFKLLYQIVDEQNDRPEAGSWKQYNYTTTGLTTTVGGTIDPYLLENQTPYVTDCNNQSGFILTAEINSGSTIFDITQTLSMPSNASPQTLQFGDERFFYGNLDTYIGATIFKTIFGLMVNASQYNKTTNTTRSQDLSTNPPNIKVSELGIYNSDSDLVIMAKLSEPVPLKSGETIMFELSMDF